MCGITDFDGYLAKLSSEFTNEERAWFVDSFARHMRYRANPTNFVVNIDDVVKWLDFKKKAKAVRLLTENFTDGIDFKTIHPSGIAVHMGGGHNKVGYMLSVKTFKKMCMIARTSKADAVRDYYVKMEGILLDHMEAVLVNSIKDKDAAVSATLVKQSKRKNAFYIARMETLDEDEEDSIYKAGSTEDVEDRRKSLRRDFGSDPLFLEVIITDRHRELEKFVLDHDLFKARKYNEPVNGKHRSRECFRGTMADFETVRNIARNRSRDIGTIGTMTALEFANIKVKETELRIMETDARVREAKIEAEIPLIQAHASIAQTCSELARKTLANPHDMYLHQQYDRALQALSASSSAPTATSTAVEADALIQPVFASAKPKVDIRHGRAVQRYEPQTLEFVDSFPAIAMALQACGDDNSGSPSGLKKAIEGNHEYLGYRWAFVEKDQPRDTPMPIEDTVVLRSSRPGLIAKLHPTKNCVVDVYATQKQASEAEGLKSSQSITLAIHSDKKRSRGHRWVYWKDVDAQAQEEYLQHHDLPEEFGRSGRSVRQMDPC